MRRLLFAVGLLLTIAVSDSSAGYYVVRVVLEGGGANDPALAAPGMGAMPAMPGPLGAGRSGGGPGPGPGPMGPLPGRPGIGMPGLGGEGGVGVPVARSTTTDPTRSVVVIVPFTKAYSKQTFYVPRKGAYATGPYWDFVLNHPRGRTNLYIDNSTYQLYTKYQNVPEVKYPFPAGSLTFQGQIERKHDTWAKTQDPQALFDLIVEALENGMVSEAVEWSDQLVKLVEEKKANTSQQVSQFIQAYRQVQGPMKARLGPSTEVETWKTMFNAAGDFGDARVRSQGHYTLIYWDMEEEEVAQRLTRLEENFRAFYLWHALQGISLKVPTRPLIVVVLREAKAFHQIREDFGRPFLVNGDSFITPHSNLLIVSPERTDGIGLSFRRSNHLNVFQGGLSRKALLNGEGPKLVDVNQMQPMPGVGPGGEGGLPAPGGGRGGQPPPLPMPGAMQPGNPMGTPAPMTKDRVALAMTLAMVERYDTDATEFSAVSSDGSRQLLVASGLLPEHVELPLWLSSGSGLFFQRPRDPVYSGAKDDKATMSLSLTTGYGRPNYVMQFHFRQMDQKKELNQNPATLLRNVVTDSYFFAAATGKDLDNPAALAKEDRAEEVKRLDALSIKAQATSWALYYYLVKNRPTELLAYFDELSRMPRDLSLDPEAKLSAFVRVFRLTNAAGEPDEAAMAAFAKGWLDSVRFVPEAWVNIEVTTPPPSQGGPGVPGGPMMPGGPPRPGNIGEGSRGSPG